MVAVQCQMYNLSDERNYCILAQFYQKDKKEYMVIFVHHNCTTMAQTSVADFLGLLSIYYIFNLSSVYELAKLKIQKVKLCKGRCRSNATSIYYCKSCSRINSRLCRCYHSLSPLEELVMRLAYEYIFDIITFDELRFGKWTLQCGRDIGHHQRVNHLLARLLPSQLQKCRWLRF